MTATTCNSKLISEVLTGLEAGADPNKAAQQQKYMKSSLPDYGVGVPEVRRLTKAALFIYPVKSRAEFEGTIQTLWDNVSHREQWYAALTIATAATSRRFLDEESLPLLRCLIESGAWWDVVDDIATHLVGPLVVAENESNGAELADAMREWARDENFWIRRTAIICQVGGRSAVNTMLLSDVIEPSLNCREFFLRKAIGWALRDFSRTDPQWVSEYVEHHRDRLSGLSLREATKYL